MGEYRFPPWLDRTRPLVGALLVIVPVYVIGLLYYAGTPRTTDVGYCPQQSVPYSHAMHAGELGMDCRYCHNTVERAAFAAIPPTAACMICHETITPNSEKMLPIRESVATGNPVHWVKVHDLADFVYFDHSAHVARGVGCYSCHGRIDRMEQVSQVHTLSMAWCLDCHSHSEPYLRPQEFITKMDWIPNEDLEILGARLRRENNINPSTDCSTCHR